MQQTKYNISQCARIIGKSRATVERHIKSKPISFELDENGYKLIDASELQRVYGDKCNFLQEGKRAGDTDTKRSESKERQADSLGPLQERLIQKYAEENAHLKELLEKALDNQSGITRLIEDRSETQQKWQELLEETRAKIAQETSEKLLELEEQHKLELVKWKRAWRYEQQKTWWDKLWGSRPHNPTGSRGNRDVEQRNRATGV